MPNAFEAQTRCYHLCIDYDAAGQITKWSQKQGTAPQTEYALHNDAAGQLDGATLKDSTTSSVLKQFAWGFDAAGNRVSQTVDAVVTTYTANALNQMTQVQDGNPLVFKGRVNKPAVVQVQGVSVTADSNNRFSVPLSLSYGAHTVTVTAQSGAESLTQTYGVFSGQALVYDLDGELLSDGLHKYDWDAAGRLVKVSTLNPGPSNPAKSSEFTYDGLWRRVRMLEKQGVQTVADRRFVWIGSEVKEERDASNAVQKRFYTNGVLGIDTQVAMNSNFKKEMADLALSLSAGIMGIVNDLRNPSNGNSSPCACPSGTK